MNNTKGIWRSACKAHLKRFTDQLHQTWLMVALSAFCITGCAGIPLTSVYKMMNTNPVAFDPDKVAVAVKRTNVVQVETGDVEMQVFIKGDESQQPVLHTYYLVVDNAPRLPTFLSKLRHDEALTVMTLSTDDAKRFHALQAKMKAHLRAGGHIDDFGFIVRILNGCKRVSNIPTDVFLSLYLKLEKYDDFFPLYQDVNIGKVDLAPLKQLSDWNTCTVPAEEGAGE